MHLLVGTRAASPRTSPSDSDSNSDRACGTSRSSAACQASSFHAVRTGREIGRETPLHEGVDPALVREHIFLCVCMQTSPIHIPDGSECMRGAGSVASSGVATRRPQDRPAAIIKLRLVRGAIAAELRGRRVTVCFDWRAWRFSRRIIAGGDTAAVSRCPCPCPCPLASEVQSPNAEGCSLTFGSESNSNSSKLMPLSATAGHRSRAGPSGSSFWTPDLAARVALSSPFWIGYRPGPAATVVDGPATYRCNSWR